MHWQRNYRQAPSDPRYLLGIRGEHEVAELLRKSGRTVAEQPNKAEFDLLVDGLRVEVKTGRPKLRPLGVDWMFNIQSNGILDERADLYVFRMEGAEIVHLLFKAPLGVRGKRISENMLQVKYFKAAEDFKVFATTGAVRA